jgi:hypothetical protein
MPTESTMLYARSRPSKANRGDVDLTTRRLIEVSVNPFDDLWAKVTRKIDRALTSIGGYARDEALAEVLEIRS